MAEVKQLLSKFIFMLLMFPGLGIAAIALAALLTGNKLVEVQYAAGALGAVVGFVILLRKGIQERRKLFPPPHTDER